MLRTKPTIPLNDKSTLHDEEIEELDDKITIKIGTITLASGISGAGGWDSYSTKLFKINNICFIYMFLENFTYPSQWGIKTLGTVSESAFWPTVSTVIPAITEPASGANAVMRIKPNGIIELQQLCPPPTSTYLIINGTYLMN